MNEPASLRCLNCGEVFDSAFCPACGQAASVRRLETRAVFVELVTKISSFDSKVWNTAIGLTRNPGRVCREYVEGKRIGYVPPLKYCLTVLAAVVLWYAIIGIDLASSAPDLGVQSSEKIRAVQQVVGTYVARHLNIVIIAALPVFAAIVTLLFRRAGRNYAEVVAFVLYVMAQVMLLSIVLSPFRSAAPGAVVAIRILFQVAFFSWAATGFFGVSPRVAVVKTVAATLCYFFIVAGIVFALAFPKVLAAVRSHPDSSTRTARPSVVFHV